MIQPLNIIDEDVVNVCKNIDTSQFDGKDVLITGASGLLGLYFVASIKRAHRLNGSSEGKIIAVIHSELEDHVKPLFDGIQIVQGDLSDYTFCQSLPRADFIIHAAGYGQPGKFMDNQVKTIKLNTLTTCALFDKLNKGGKFLFLSSSEVYSGLEKEKHQETDIGTTNTTHPRACYIEAKRCGEAICGAERLRGVDAKVARLALAYGPGTKKQDKRVLNAFIEKGLVESKIDMLDQGEAVRTYCYVADAVEMMLNILLKGKDMIYNVGGVSEITIRGLAEEIGKNLHTPVNLPEQKEEYLKDAPKTVGLDISKVVHEFSKHNFISLEEGIKRTIEWQKFLYTK